MPPFTLSRDQVRELDRRAAEEFGVPGIVLMENAGRGCAELLMLLNPTKKPAVVMCGPGNNGGDGFVVARHLDNHGWPVEVWLFAFRDHLAPDAAENYRRIKNIGAIPPSPSRLRQSFIKPIIIREMPDAFASGMGGGLYQEFLTRAVIDWGGRWIVDALYGIGMNRSIAHPVDLVVTAVNAARTLVFAVDLPSGLDCDTGEPLGPTIRATHTATFVAPKKGFLNPKSKEWTGEVHVVDIGAPRVLVEQYFPRS